MFWHGKFESLLPPKNFPIQAKYFKKQNPLPQGKNKTNKRNFSFSSNHWAKFFHFVKNIETSKWLLCFKHNSSFGLLTNHYIIWLQIPFNNQNPYLITVISVTDNIPNFYDSFQQDVWLNLIEASYIIPISARQVWFLCSFLFLLCFLDIESNYETCPFSQWYAQLLQRYQDSSAYTELSITWPDFDQFLSTPKVLLILSQKTL